MSYRLTATEPTGTTTAEFATLGALRKNVYYLALYGAWLTSRTACRNLADSLEIGEPYTLNGRRTLLIEAVTA